MGLRGILVKRLRVTEIEDFLTCRWLWDYKWNQGLRLPDDDMRAGPMITGRAVHHGLEAAVLLGGGQAAALRYAAEYLTQYEGSAKFQRGVETCIRGLDPALYELVAPQAEQELTWPIPGIDYDLVGRPDLWYIDETSGIYIIDYKTTSKEEEEKGRGYQIWSQQTPLYGLLVVEYLATLDQSLPIYLQHIILSTRGNHYMTRPLLFSSRECETQKALVTTLAAEVERCHQDPTLLYPTRNFFQCHRCDFATVDQVRLTGRDYESIIEEEYEKRRA